MPGWSIVSKSRPSTMFQRGVEALKNLLFPLFCLECKAEGELWCETCFVKTRARPFSWDPNEQSSSRNSNEQPKAATFLNKVTALCLYEESKIISECIRLLKYNFQTDHASVWRRLLSFPNLKKDFVCIPVPLHARRLRERGFNQAEYLARVVAANHGLDIVTTNLARRRHTKQQARLKKSEREKNVRNTFVWQGGAAPPRVYLVDDVYTTGATMNACAAALQQAGVEEIEGLVVARG